MRAKWAALETKLIGLSAEHTAAELAMMFHVTEKTMRNRLAVMGLRQHSETMSLREAIRRTGYLKHQLHRARKALDQRWGRVGTRRGITEEQLEALCEWLRTEAS